MAASRIDFFFPVILLLGSLLVCATLVVWRFCLNPAPGRGKWIENLSGLWTLFMYLSLGAIPYLYRLLAGPS